MNMPVIIGNSHEVCGVVKWIDYSHEDSGWLALEGFESGHEFGAMTETLDQISVGDCIKFTCNYDGLIVKIHSIT